MLNAMKQVLNARTHVKYHIYIMLRAGELLLHADTLNKD